MTAEEAVVINSGSSSVKFAAFADDEAVCPLRSAAVERIGAAAARFRVRDAAGGKLVDEVYAIGNHKERTVVTHLGNGSSMATIRDGRSVETTMGFSTLADLPMGTCCGDMAAFTAALGGLDGVVFTSGIGANAPAVRARICNGSPTSAFASIRGATPTMSPASPPAIAQCVWRPLRPMKN